MFKCFTPRAQGYQKKLKWSTFTSTFTLSHCHFSRFKRPCTLMNGISTSKNVYVNYYTDIKITYLWHRLAPLTTLNYSVLLQWCCWQLNMPWRMTVMQEVYFNVTTDGGNFLQTAQFSLTWLQNPVTIKSEQEYELIRTVDVFLFWLLLSMQRTAARLHNWYQENNNRIHTTTKPLLAAKSYSPFLDFSLLTSNTMKVSLLNETTRNEGTNSKTIKRISAAKQMIPKLPM